MTRLARALPVVVALAFEPTGSPLGAQNCASDGTCGFMDCKTPARAASSALWGDLQPVDGTPFPIERDNTDFREFPSNGFPASRYGSAEPFWMAVAATGGTLYGGIAHGIQIWDLQITPQRPSLVKVVDGPSAFRQWPSGERKQVLSDISVQGDLVATVGQPSVGIAIFDMVDKFHPRLAYQDGDKQANEVYTATIGGRAYAFIDAHASVSGETVGLLAYDMTRARDYNGCLDNAGACPGVMVKQILGDSGIQYVRGADNFLIASRGTGRGVWIWDVSNVTSPAQKLLALTGEAVYGVNLWRDTASGKYYMATRHNAEARIYDVNCITTGSGCTGLGAPIWTQAMVGGTTQYYITFSRSSDAAYLYFGSDQICGGGPTREFMIDVTNLANIRDITPPQTIDVSGVATGYWTWYYRNTPTGFNKTAGRRGIWSGSYFYRAAFSLLDIHKRTTPVPPVANFTPPSPIYVGVPTTFDDASSGTVTSRLWTFQDGAVIGSSAPSGDLSGSAPLAPEAMDPSGPRFVLGSFGSAPIILTNPGARPLAVALRFVGAGSTSPLARGDRFELGPHERREISANRFGSAAGTLIVEASGGAAPRIDSSGGVTFTAAAAASAGEVWRLGAGLVRSALVLLYNPGDEPLRVDLVYRDASDRVLGTLSEIEVAPGQVRAIRSARHPIGRAERFSVEAQVLSGRLLASVRPAIKPGS